MVYVRIAIYGRNTAAPYRIKHLKLQNTVRNVRSVTVYGPSQYGRYRIRYGAEPYSRLLYELWKLVARGEFHVLTDEISTSHHWAHYCNRSMMFCKTSSFVLTMPDRCASFNTYYQLILVCTNHKGHSQCYNNNMLRVDAISWSWWCPCVKPN